MQICKKLFVWFKNYKINHLVTDEYDSSPALDGQNYTLSNKKWLEHDRKSKLKKHFKQKAILQ